MPDTLSPYELDAIRQRDQNAAHPGKTWAVQDRRALLAHIDAADRWWAERFRLMHRSDPAGRTAYMEAQARAVATLAE